jgi:signal transduction histidine kinase
MTSIFGFSELLKTRNFDRATTLDIVTTIHSEAGRLVHLLNELLDLSRIEARAGKAFDFKLQPLVPIIDRSIAELLVPGDDRRVQVELDQNLPPLLLDGDKIKQAMINILSNAYKYSPPGSRIDLMAFHDGADASRRVGIRVTDRGVGMSAQERSHFFERFWRAESAKSVPGSGLGMSLVKEIVHFHRGTIDVLSEKGQGTQITVWLPCDDQRTEASAC